MIAKVSSQPYERIAKQIAHLLGINQAGDDLEVVRFMKIMVPEFISNSSRYEVLDEQVRLHQPVPPQVMQG